MKKDICEVRIEGIGEHEDKVTRILDKARVRFKEMTRYRVNDEDGNRDIMFLIRFEMNEKNFYKIRKKLSRYCFSMTVGNPQ